MQRIFIWTGLIMLLCAALCFAANLWLNNESRLSTKSTTVRTGEVPSSDSTKGPKTTTDDRTVDKNLSTQNGIQDIPSNQATKHSLPKPLNLDLDNLKTVEPSTATTEGPFKPSTEAPLSEPTIDNTLQLDGKKSKQDKLLYGYEGKDEDDRHSLKLGVQKDDVTIKSGIKKGDDDTEIHNIEIEIKLPK